MTPISDKWQTFFERYCKDQLSLIADLYPDLRTFVVDYFDLERYDLDTAEKLLVNPEPVLEELTEALKDHHLGVNKNLDQIHIRISNLPNKVGIRDIRNHHIGKFIVVEGIIRQSTMVSPRITIAAFKCQRCEHITMVEQTESKFTNPLECDNELCKKKGPYSIDNDRSTFVDSQRFKLQESPERLHGGQQPQSIEIVIEDDISGIVKPGDVVAITGTLQSRRKDKSTLYEPFIHANHIETEHGYEDLDIQPEDIATIKELADNPAIFELMAQSFAPSIHGYHDIKEALILQLFTGVSGNHADGSTSRGDIHILLVGDPGLGKSQLLKYAVNTSPRGIFVSGKGASAAGLTAAVVKDEFGDGQWTLEAGALVLADSGITAVDEMDKMSKEDRSALHSAMEQQIVTIAKAGIIATLRSRCSLLGAANPKAGRFDIHTPLTEQINMPPSLLSRFDLIFYLQDTPDYDSDLRLGTHIGKSRQAIVSGSDGRTKTTNDMGDVGGIDGIGDVDGILDSSLLQKYIAYTRERIRPTLPDDVINHIGKYYATLRGQDEADQATPVTPRQVEGLYRLSEASARIRLSDTVEMVDAQRAIRITQACLKQLTCNEDVDNFNVDRIAVGSSKTQRDNLKRIKNLLADLENKTNGPVPLAKLISKAQESLSLPAEEIEALLKKLSAQGEVIKPTRGHIKLVK